MGPPERKHYDLVVEPAITTLQQNCAQLFPGERDHRQRDRRSHHPVGPVSSNNDVRSGRDRQAALRSEVINMLQLPSGSGEPASHVAGPLRRGQPARAARSRAELFIARPQRVLRSHDDAAVRGAGFENRRRPKTRLLQFSDFLNMFFFSSTQGWAGSSRRCSGRGFLQSLAEPNLIAYNGQEASFLAGGEIPVPRGDRAGQLSILYKEFGIRLSFTPTIAGDIIRLKVAPEVSTLDFSNGITLEGFRIPALSTRRAQTNVELRDGQSFAIAGLLDNLTQRIRGDSLSEPDPDHRQLFQEQGRSRRAHRADGVDHAAPGARARA